MNRKNLLGEKNNTSSKNEQAAGQNLPDALVEALLKAGILDCPAGAVEGIVMTTCGSLREMANVQEAIIWALAARGGEA